MPEMNNDKRIWLTYSWLIISLVAIALTIETIRAQSPAVRKIAPFKELRFDETYAYLATDSLRTNAYERVKFIPLSTNRKAYLSLGGEARTEIARFGGEDWGEGNEGNVTFWLQRYQLHADIHLGWRLRVFGQLRSGLEQGRRTGPRPIDEDQLNVQLLFADYTIGNANKSSSIRVRFGRQEINYGSERFISVRDGPNLRLSFDGLTIRYVGTGWQADALLMQSIQVPPGLLDNYRSGQINLWGIYATRQGQDATNHLDWYYLGVFRPRAIYKDGQATETRHTVGARL
ncbi:Alginate export [Spirosoma endophyticum]|uniref:Alginate export n=1 Tax=Spirosoma endophyticum TaxID=662367 RepID=A0A1I1LED3_9BACT|nr:Alginate export [Spirosoma endophyticum]